MNGRCRPIRAGIVGLWDYTIATFDFADGRLVLRGANGSGKTKALEVLFPFVLDGRLDPRRLDPFSGENRTMKDNLLWRGTDTGYGYAWLEFADADRHITVGVGVRAQRHRPSPDSWFFVVDGRVGHDFALVVDGRPRTRRELTAALGDDVVVERSTEHRRRVDAALFGLGTQRYEAMLDLVLTLRRPMLAKDLDPRLLSDTLTRGLRPLDDDLLEQVARSFDDLEAVQRDLDQLAAADDATQAFLTDYRGYLRTQARHRADAAIDAEAGRVAAVERDDAARRALDAARTAETAAEADAADAEARLATDRARRDALTASEAFKTAGQLEHLDRSVRDLAAELDRAERRDQQARTAAEDARRTHEVEQATHTHAETAARTRRPQVAASAAEAGIEWADPDGRGEPAQVRQRVGARVAARQADLDAVRGLLAAAEDADRRVVAAEQALERAEDDDEQTRDALAQVGRAVTAARGQLRDAVVSWASDHEMVDDADRDAVLAAVAATGDDGADLPAPVWQARLRGRREDATARRARLQDAAGTLDEQRDALAGRRQTILDEHDDAPPALDWRGQGRHDRGGAPLWRLVRFTDEVDPVAAAGVEAALEAAGLLDAWVQPDGDIADDMPDAFLAAPPADDAAVAPEHTTLATVLRPDDQDAVPHAVVMRLLTSIRLGTARPATGPDPDPRVEVGDDGHYRLGPLAGTHRVAAPRYIGATARAAHRTARIAALDDELAELAAQADGVAAQLRSVDAWLAAADAATAALPTMQALREQLRAQDHAAGRCQQARAALEATRPAAQTARREANDDHAALRREAGRRSLPASHDGIATVSSATRRFADDGASLAAAVELAAARAEAVEAAAARAQAAAEAAESTGREVTDRRRAHHARTVEFTTLRDRMGASVADVLAQVEQVEAGIEAGEHCRRQAAVRVRDAAAGRGQALGEVTAATDAVAVAAARTDTAQQQLAVLARPDLADPLQLSVDPDSTVEQLLQTVDELVAGVSGTDERRKAAQTRISRGLEDLQRSLGSSYRPAWDMDDALIVVTVGDDLGVRSVAAFAHQLGTQRDEQEALLTARERALFEDTLLTSVCGQIHARTQATRDLVATMDREMRARRLSSGQTVGVSWRAEDTATNEWKRVHRLLDQDPAHFGPDQLDELRRHFAAEIKSARAADPQSPYRELLADVLDYRRWRRFELFLVEADGTESPLTRARHARLSGGEKAASLHLPLFAAAHAAFAGARPGCPRLLGLDEAFAGIDDQGRSELLSLTVTFDLDLFMTGYDLWAVDPAVPAVAHYDLLHLPSEHAVSALLVLWNGSELVEGPDAEAALAEG